MCLYGLDIIVGFLKWNHVRFFVWIIAPLLKFQMPFHFLKYKSSNLPEIEAGSTPQGTLYRLMPLHLPFVSEVLMRYMESILMKACYI